MKKLAAYFNGLLLIFLSSSCQQVTEIIDPSTLKFISVNCRVQGLINATAVPAKGVLVEVNGGIVATTDDDGSFFLKNSMSEGAYRFRFIGRSNITLLDTTVKITRQYPNLAVNSQSINLVFQVIFPSSETALYVQNIDFPLSSGNEWKYIYTEDRYDEWYVQFRYMVTYSIIGSLTMKIKNVTTFRDSLIGTCEATLEGKYTYSKSSPPMTFIQSTISSVTTFDIVQRPTSITFRNLNLFNLISSITTATIPTQIISNQHQDSILSLSSGPVLTYTTKLIHKVGMKEFSISANPYDRLLGMPRGSVILQSYNLKP